MQVLSSFWKQSKGVEEKVDLLKKSIERTLGFVDKLIMLFEKEYPKDPSSKGEFVINLFELYDEIVYQEMLEPLWQVWQFPMGRKWTDAYAREINRLLFFKKALQEYRNCICP